MKKKIVILSFFLMLIMGLTGCGKSQAVISDHTDNAVLSKSEWIGVLGNGFGYDLPENDLPIYSDVGNDDLHYTQIQACAEWGIITETGSFEPNANATWKYAIETAVRAIGIENINNAGEQVSEDSLVAFFGQKIANISDIDLDAAITAADAEQIVQYTLDYSYKLAPIEVFDYTYNDQVYEITADDILLCGDGQSAWITNNAVYQSGDILYILPSDTTPAAAIRIVSCDENKLTYEQAGLEDVYSELKIAGSYEAAVLAVEGAEEQTDISYSGNGSYVPCVGDRRQYDVISAVGRSENMNFLRTGASVSDNSVNFSYALGDGGNVSVNISNICVNTDIEYGFLKLKKANATVSFQDEISVSYTADHYARTIPLGKVKLQIGTTPCNVELSLVLNIGVDGKASLTYTSQVVGRVNYREGCGLSKSLDNRNGTLDFHAEATVTAEPTAKVDLRLLGESVVNLKVTSGIVAIATLDVDIMGDQPACLDIYLYVPLSWAVNEDNCLLTYISKKLQYSSVIWNSENSGLTKRFHMEDGVLVDKCTRGDEKKVETSVVDEEGQPYDEYKIFEFEEIDFDVISLYSSKVYLEAGQSMSIGFSAIPEGYSAGDLVYSVYDSSICNVSGGVVSGNASGSTTVKVSTPDGKYNAYFTVTVKGDFNDMTDFKPL